MASKKTSVVDRDITMKVVLAAAILLAFIGGYLVARAKYKPQIIELTKMVTDKDNAIVKIKADANRIVMRDGKMWVIENGMVNMMEDEMTMPNGAKVMTDGKIVASDGKELMMQEGDAMDMDGVVIPGNGQNNTNSPSF